MTKIIAKFGIGILETFRRIVGLLAAISWILVYLGRGFEAWWAMVPTAAFLLLSALVWTAGRRVGVNVARLWRGLPQ